MAQMMIKCKSEISSETNALIQKHRVNIPAFKNHGEYEDLIAVDWDALRHIPEAEEEVKKVEEKPKKPKTPTSEDPDAEEKEMLDGEEDEIDQGDKQPETAPEPVKEKVYPIELTQEEKIMAT